MTTLILSISSLIFSFYCILDYDNIETKFEKDRINIFLPLQILFSYYLLFFVFKFNTKCEICMIGSIVTILLILKDSIALIGEENRNGLFATFALNLVGYLTITALLLHKIS